MNKPKLKVCWISAGVSSFVAGYLVRDTVDEFLYIPIKDQHEDSDRFIADCATALGREIKRIKSEEYSCVGDVCRAFRFVNSAYGAKCTEVLKKRVRKKWEFEHQGFDITYVWGFDSSEKKRADNIIESMPYFHHEFPLIDRNLTKADAHGICASLGIKRPAMYDIGYSNNNCIGCVKGGKGYWNQIRRDFPEVFADRAKMEREIGHSILHDKNGMIFLDELDPNAGRMSEEIMEDCSIFCQMALEQEV